MNVDLRYAGRSGLAATLAEARLAFAANVLRETTFFRGEVGRVLPMREGLAALAEVAVSDFKYRPRDRSAFDAWRAEQDRRFLAALGARTELAGARLTQLEARLGEIDAARASRRASFESARRAYIAWAVRDACELAFVLDPVVTVHPDQLSLEAFSRDQSSYARLAIGYEAFRRIDAFECGTTNVDFSHAMRDAFDRMRSYRTTCLEVCPRGVSVASDTAPVAPNDLVTVHEKSIALPAGWLAGFLQVHGLFSMGLERLRLAPVDAFNLVRFLRRHRAKTSPRSLRWELRPGEPIRVVIEPFGALFTCSPVSRHAGRERSIRTWGRDRLRTLERLLPVAESVDVHLAGTGLPSVWVVRLGGDVVFTLALSGWTDNDWVEGRAKFDLLTRRLAPSPTEITSVYQALRTARYASAESIAAVTGLGLELTRSALSILAQAGRAMVDFATGLHRHRDLLLEPFDAVRALASAELVASEGDPRAKLARELVASEGVRIIARRPTAAGYKLSGNARADATRVRPQLAVDREGRILEATCTCVFAEKHGLTKGPCEHILALRLAHMDRLAKEDKN